MNKKQIALFIMLVLVATLFVTPYKKKVVADSPYQYEVISETDKTARLTHISSPGEKVVIPQSIDGYKIIEVGRFQQKVCTYDDYEKSGILSDTQGVFSENERNIVKELVFPNGIINIGHGAFAYCDDLSKVSFSNTIKNIGARAFAQSGSLSAIELKSKLETVGYRAFGLCRSLKRIEVSSAKVTIGEYAFWGSAFEPYRTNLTKIVLPKKFQGKLLFGCFDGYVGDSFDWIEFSSTNNCEGIFNSVHLLKKVNFPDFVKNIYIGKNTFCSAASIARFELPETAKKFSMGQQQMIVDTIIVKGKKTDIIKDKSMDYDKDNYINARTIIAPKGSKAEKYAKECYYPDVYNYDSSISMYSVDNMGYKRVKYIPVSLPSKPKVTLSGKKVKWTKTKKAEKYEIYYSAKKKGTYKLVATTKKTSYSLKKKGYVKVRAVRKTYGTDWRGDFSKVVKMK